jgi:hypothetical protein
MHGCQVRAHLAKVMSHDGQAPGQLALDHLLPEKSAVVLLFVATWGEAVLPGEHYSKTHYNKENKKKIKKKGNLIYNIKKHIVTFYIACFDLFSSVLSYICHAIQ